MPGSRSSCCRCPRAATSCIDRRLDQAGGKGLFVKELENALAEGRARSRGAFDEGRAGRAAAGVRAGRDHSRARIRGTPSFPPNTRPSVRCRRARTVGTSSLRRAAQIVERHPAPRGAPAARQRRDAAGQARSRRVRRHRARRRRPDAARPRSAHPRAPRRGREPAGARAGRARHRMPGRRAPTSLALLAPLARRGERRLRARRARRQPRARRQLHAAARARMPNGRPANRLRLRALVASSDGKRVVRSELEADAADPEALGDRGRAGAAPPGRGRDPWPLIAAAGPRASSSRGRAAQAQRLARLIEAAGGRADAFPGDRDRGRAAAARRSRACTSSTWRSSSARPRWRRRCRRCAPGRARCAWPRWAAARAASSRSTASRT